MDNKIAVSEAVISKTNDLLTLVDKFFESKTVKYSTNKLKRDTIMNGVTELKSLINDDIIKNEGMNVLMIPKMTKK